MGKPTRTEAVCLILAVCFLILTAAVRISDARREPVTVETGIIAENPADGEETAGLVSGRININTADAWMLTLLNGIGEAKAEAIIDYREQNGPFSDIEEIMNVSGIGPVTFDGIKDYICTEDGE